MVAILAHATEHHDKRVLELMSNKFHCGVAPLEHDPQFDTHPGESN